MLNSFDFTDKKYIKKVKLNTKTSIQMNKSCTNISYKKLVNKKSNQFLNLGFNDKI